MSSSLDETDVDNLKADPGLSIDLVGDGPLVKAVRAQMDRAAASRVPSGPITVIDEGNDAETIRSLLHARNASNDRQIVAHIVDLALLDAVDRKMRGGVFRPALVNVAALVSERFYAQTGLFKYAFYRDQARLHVAIIGSGGVARALIDGAVLNGIADGLDKPLIHWFTKFPDQATVELRQQMPEIGASADIVIRPLEPNRVGSLDQSPLIAIDAATPLTAILLAPDDSQSILSMTARIIDLQHRTSAMSAALFLCGTGANVAYEALASNRYYGHLGRRISVMDDLPEIQNLLHYILVERDEDARALHEAYQRSYGGQTKGSNSWDTLDETYRRANRRAASHLNQKLWAIGVATDDKPASMIAVDQSVYDDVIRPLVESGVEDDTMRRLARLEHDRWCADRRLDSWRFGHARDDLRRVHPSLIPFDSPDLTADEVGKDIAQLRFVFSNVVRGTEHGPGTRLCVGVSALEGEQKGLSLDSAILALGGFPNRAIEVMSGLLSEHEIHTVSALLSSIQRSHRHVRLIVLEASDGNRETRSSEAALSPQLQTLLASERTLIAPIRQTSHDDLGWSDASSAADEAAAIAACIEKHANMLVNAVTTAGAVTGSVESRG